MRAYAYGAKPPTENAELVRQQLILAHRYGNQLVEIELARREEVEAADEDEAATRAANEKAGAAVRAARGECGVFWGTYLLVEDGLQRSRRSGAAPRFRRYDGGGTLAVQIQGGLPVAELLAGEDRRARLLGEGRHRTLYLRVGSAGRDPVWATFPIVYHRDLPEGSTVKWVRCVSRRVGTHYKWSAQIVLDDLPERQLPAPTRGTIAIDVGWRRVPGGTHVATWVDDTGEVGEVVLPDRLQERAGKVADLAAIRDKNFNAARDVLRAWRGEATLPEWFREATASMHAWRAPARLASLALRWRRDRFEGDGAAYDAVEAWRRQDKHLLEWEANQRENVLRARREMYRIFARQVATYRKIVVEKLDLREFAEVPARPAEEDPRIRASRGRRFQAALSELLGSTADAAQRSGSEFIEAPSAWTTQTCSACGKAEPFDAGAEIRHTCSHCGRTWDQDENAARNLLRAAERGEITATRSRRKAQVDPEDSPAAARRAKGLATRRARRSQKGSEPAT